MITDKNIIFIKSIIKMKIQKYLINIIILNLHIKTKRKIYFNLNMKNFHIS